MQDEKQALHECVRTALVETQNAAVADRTGDPSAPEGDVEAAVNAQIQQRRNQQASPLAQYRGGSTWRMCRNQVI